MATGGGLILLDGTTPNNPPAGSELLYVQSGVWYSLSSAGVSTPMASEGRGTPASSAQSLTASSANLVTGTSVAVPTGLLAVGNRYRFTLGFIKTAAGVATWTAAVKWGTANTIADSAIATWTSGTNTAAIDQAILVIEVVIATLGAAATANCIAFYCNQQTNVTGLGNIAAAPSPTATFASTLTNPFLHVDVTPGASAVMTGWGMAEQVA